MLQSLKPFQCPGCNYSYTIKDSSRGANVSRFPLLLKCGHTLCETCIKNTSKGTQNVTCRICKNVTEVSGGDTSKLLTDVYALGVLSANANKGIPNLKIRFTPGPKTQKKDQNKNGAYISCEHCLDKEAAFRCEKCEENFCNSCFDEFHEAHGKNLRRHVGIPVYAHIYTSVVQEGCAEHDNRAIEFFCEDDEQLTCSLCVVTGSHKGHTVLTLAEKNKVYVDYLKLAREEASIINRRLKLAEQKLISAIPSEKIDSSPLVYQVHEHFHSLHAALIIRENEILRQLDQFSNGSASKLEEMRQEVSLASRDLEAVLRDAEHVLSNLTASVSVPAIVKKLQDANSLPCHVVPVTKKESRDICLNFDDSLKEAIMKHGNIIAPDTEPRLSLKSSAELPCDFIIEQLPSEPSVCSENDSESQVSDVFSEDSLNSSRNTLTSLFAAPGKPGRILSSHEKVFVCHIRDPSHFWVVRSSDLKKLKMMSAEINQWCKREGSKKHTPQNIIKGDFYLVQYTVDNKWYRARALAIVPVPVSSTELGIENKNCDLQLEMPQELYVSVCYVDFGNTETVPISSMRNIPNKFLCLPGLAKLCCLFGISPISGSKWAVDSIKTFSNFVKDKEVYMQVIEEANNVLQVDLSQGASLAVKNDVPVSVRDALVFLEHGCFCESDKTLHTRTNRSVKSFLPPEELRANAKVTVHISYVESPSLFYVQQRATSRHLAELIVEMQKVYSAKTSILHAVYVPYVGMMCAARFEKDGYWYRAEVIGLPGSARVEVHYIDFGNREVLPHRNIRKLLDKFCKMTTQAIPCSLADVTFPQGSKGWSIEAKEWLTNEIAMNQLTLLSLGMVPGEKHTKAVIYYVQDDKEVCVNSALVQKGLAVSSGKFSSSEHLTATKEQPKQSSPVRLSESKETIAGVTNSTSPTAISLKPPVLKSSPAQPITNEIVSEPIVEVIQPSLKPKDEPEDSVKVRVSHVESPGMFYIRIDDVEEKLKTLMKIMQETYTGFEGSAHDVTEGSNFAALRGDGKWYRVIVLTVMSDKEVKVRCVDYGYVEVIPTTNLRVLLEQFQSEQTFAICCHLDGVVPAGDSKKWSQSATQLFKDIIQPHDVLQLVAESHIKGNSLSCDLLYKEVIRGGALEPSTIVFVSIVKKLVEKGVALPSRKKQDHSSKVAARQNNASTSVSPAKSTVCSEGCSKPLSHAKKTAETSDVRPGKPSFTWKPAELPISLHFEGVPTHVGEDGTLFLQIKPAATSMVDLITKVMEMKYIENKPEKLDAIPPVGEAVAAKFVIDQMWYRAEIVSDNPDKIMVQFVDYGNCEILTLDEIRTDLYMKDVPRQCIECTLHELKIVKGRNLPTEFLDLIHSSIVEQDCEVDVKELPVQGKKPVISLTRKDKKTDFARILHKIVTAMSSTDGEGSDPAAAICTQMPDDLRVIHSIGYKTANQLKPMKPFKVCITSVIGPDMVCLQQLKVDSPTTDEDHAHNLELDLFLELMDDLSMKAKNFPSIVTPHPGLACCVQYTYDNRWYRCEITEVTDKGIHVFYVDYGNAEVLPLERLRKPEENLLSFPVQAHTCRLRGLEPVGDVWTEQIMEALLNRLIHWPGEIYAKVIVPGKVCVIDLLIKDDNDEFVLAYQDMIDKGLVKFEP